MSETEIINGVKRGLYTIVNQYYDTLMADRTELNKNIYYKVLDYYKKINSSRTISEIKVYLNEIKSEMASLKEQYLSKVSIYESMDKSGQALEAASLLGEIKDITKLAQALNDTYSQTKGMLSKLTPKKEKTNVSDNKPKDENKPKIVVQETPKKTLDLSGIDFKNPIVNALYKLTNQIIELKEKLVKLDPMSKDAINLRKKLNEISDKRLDIANKLFGNDGINYIRSVESLETRLANCSNTGTIKSYEVDSDEYVQELEDLIYTLGDLKFYGEESKYVSDKNKYDEVYLGYYDKFMNLVNSLYGEKNPLIYSYADYNITVSDLISYLGVYNFRGGYQNFKEHHKTGKIGSEAISKEMYASGLDKIAGFIDSFKNKSSDMIKSNGNKVTIKDSRETKDILKFQIDSKMIDLYKVICSKMQVKNTGVSL